jgi:hypothetical protein
VIERGADCIKLAKIRPLELPQADPLAAPERGTSNASRKLNPTEAAFARPTAGL